MFVDGCYWHGCPLHYVPPKTNSSYWSTKIRSNVERDRDTDRRLVNEGWAVVRVWQHDDPEEAAGRIERLVIDRRQ